MSVRTLLCAATIVPLGACQMAGPTYTPQQIAYDQQQLAAVIGPRLAHKPEACLIRSPSMDIRAVGNTIVARYGGRVWVNQVHGTCREASNGGATLVFDSSPGGTYCANSLVKVVDFGGATVGSCSLGSWTPYY